MGNLLVGLDKRSEAEEQYRKPLEIWEKLAANFPAVPEYHQELADGWYNFACFFAIAKEADKKQEYTDRAMEMLHKAVEAGFKDAAHMAKDTDLNPLRERADFKKLLESLTAPKK